MSMAYEGRAYTCSAKGVNLNALGDTPVKVPFSKYIVRTMTITNASATLAGSSMTVGAYGAPAAGSLLISTPATKVGLTAAAKWLDCTIASPATTDSFTSGTLYVNVGVVHGAAMTADVYFELMNLENPGTG